MNNKGFLAKSIRYALLGSVVTGVFASGFAIAAEEEKKTDKDENAKVERIEVTGSRIKQVDMESASPVTVITAADIKVTGETSVADVLNNTSANSFGSWRGMSGYGAGASATSDINLRGLGAQATLVLLDGRRMPGTSSSSGTVADTSTIPMAIVERIEILRDGASAVYGSDAVAGVINIITKKDFDGVELNYDGEVPKVEGGNSNRFSIATGFTTDRGNINVTFEHYDTQAVFDRDIWKVNDPDYYGFSSFSSVPNGYYNTGNLDEDGDPIYSFYSNSDMCGQTENVVDSTDGVNNGRCLYSYGQVTKLFGDVNKNNLLSNFNYKLADDLTLRGRLMASTSETQARYAGTPVSTNYPVMAADNPNNPTGKDMTLYMRSVQIGERDSSIENTSIDALLGLQGYIDVGNGIDWEVNAQHTRSKTNEFSYNLINDNIIQSLIDTGDYDIFNTTGMSYTDWNAQMEDLYYQASHTGAYEGKFISSQIDGLVSTTLVTSGDFSLAGVVGSEYEKIKYVQKSDPESAQGIISGGSGGDDVDATRDRTSVYVELQANLPYNIDLSAAARYEKYEQEGNIASGHASSTFDDLVPKLSASWRPIDDLLVRASWGKSFRAPNMGEMFSGEALSFESTYDTVYCSDNTDANYCRSGQQHKTLYGGNPDLKAEEGESATVGFVWNILDNLSLETSYYHITYDNKIEVVDVADLVREEVENGGSPYIVRGDDGKIETIHSQYRNLSGVKTSGIDLVSRYKLETGVGDFGFKLEASKIFEYKQQNEAGAEYFDYSGLQDYPELRGNISVDWNYDNWSAAWTTYYISSQNSGNEEYGVDYLKDIPSYVKHNVQVSYTHPWNGSITLGVNNLFDKEAPNWYNDGYDFRDANTGLYDVLGRTLYVTVNQKF
jgi:outer membrane receptor protein involved in Fe transport